MTSLQTSGKWYKLKQWSPVLLYLSGVLIILLVIARLWALQLPLMPYLGPTGSLLGLAGIMGMYPPLSTGTPRLARAGVIVLGITAIAVFAGFTANAVFQLNQSRQFIPMLVVIHHTTFVAMIIGMLLFGAAAVSSRNNASLIGYLLLLLAVLTAIEFILIITQTGFMTFLTTAALVRGLIYIAIGYMMYDI